MTTEAEIAGAGRHRWTTAQKPAIVEESLVAKVSVAEVGRRDNVDPDLIYPGDAR